MLAPTGSPAPAPRRPPARTYARFCALFLFLQGSTTLAARLLPEVDRALPFLLRVTAMRPAHSLLHIASALLAAGALALGGRAPFAFAALFGVLYSGLGVLGFASPLDLCGVTSRLELQPFDHPFHLLLGTLGLAAAWRSRHRPDSPEAPGPLAAPSGELP